MENNIGTKYTKEQLLDIAYGRYQLDWMIVHGYTLKDLMECLEREEEATVQEKFEYWEAYSGFSSSCWACRDEFAEAEFTMPGYMSKLLGPEEFADWLSYHPTALGPGDALPVNSN